MRSTTGLLPFLFLMLTVSVERAVLGQTPVVVPLTNESVQGVEEILGGEHEHVWFVKFYAPWCTHCQNLAPEWDALAQSLSGDHGVHIAEVDVSANEDLGRRFNIQTLPNMKLFVRGRVYDYAGARERVALMNFVKGGAEVWGEGVELTNTLPTLKDALIQWILSYVATFVKILYVAPSVYVPPFAFGMCFGGVATAVLLRRGTGRAHSKKGGHKNQSRIPVLSEQDEEIILSGLKEE